MLPTVRSRCQTFVFARPRLPEIVKKLRRIADGEGIDVPDAALSLIARAARGAYRDAESTLDQLAAATEGTITVQDVLQMLGAVEEEALFRLCDLIVDRDTAGALMFVEELSEQGQDIGRLVTDLLEHLRHLMLVQHLGEVPDSLPVTEETRDRLRAQANQIPRGDRAPALRPARRGRRGHAPGRRPAPAARARARQGDAAGGGALRRVDGVPARAARAARRPLAPAGTAPSRGLSLRHAGAAAPRRSRPRSSSSSSRRRGSARWSRRSSGGRSRPRRCSARPTRLRSTDDTLTLEFPANAAFHLRLAEEPKNAGLLRDALYEVTGRKLQLEFVVGENGGPEPEEEEARRARRRSSRSSRRHSTRGRWSELSAPAKGFDMNKLMQQAQQMQTQMAQAQEQLAHEIVEASAGGGLVTVKATGTGEITEIKIDPKAIDPDDPEMLEDVVLAAVNEALRSAQNLAQSKLGGLAGGLGLPGL